MRSMGNATYAERSPTTKPDTWLPAMNHLSVFAPGLATTGRYRPPRSWRSTLSWTLNATSGYVTTGAVNGGFEPRRRLNLKALYISCIAPFSHHILRPRMPPEEHSNIGVTVLTVLRKVRFTTIIDTLNEAISQLFDTNNFCKYTITNHQQRGRPVWIGFEHDYITTRIFGSDGFDSMFDDVYELKINEYYGMSSKSGAELTQTFCPGTKFSDFLE